MERDDVSDVVTVSPRGASENSARVQCIPKDLEKSVISAIERKDRPKRACLSFFLRRLSF